MKPSKESSEPIAVAVCHLDPGSPCHGRAVRVVIIRTKSGAIGRCAICGLTGRVADSNPVELVSLFSAATDENRLLAA
jgi:hypothetical protein